MCGITGVFAFNEIGRFEMMRNRAATDALTHRGPDVGRFFNDHYVALGHRRLSILDLSAAADQPMSDPSGRYQLVFNGEIYNFRSLRQDLQRQGVEFRTQSDTEVLLHLLIREGEACLSKLNGFFAFCFYDAETHTMLLARDRLGIKPLLYFQDDDKFLFASELNALLTYNIPRELDYEALSLYFQFHYVPAPQTMLKGVRKLLPGHVLRLKEGKVETARFYTLPHNPQHYLSDYEAAQKELLRLLEQSVQDRLISDVPLGAFLSGGTDSSAIVALAARHTDRLETFSIGYRDEPLFDETTYAKAVAKAFGTKHTVFSLTNEELFEAIEGLLGFLGEPFADSSAIPTYLLSQRTRQQVTVALSGDGGDELFGGYQKYWAEYRVRKGGWLAQFLKQNHKLLERLPRSRNGFWTNKFRQAHRFAQAMHRSPQERYWFLSTFLEEQKLALLFSEDTLSRRNNAAYTAFKSGFLAPLSGKSLNEVLYQDVHTLLPNDMLTKVDSMSMANSLEVRVPFLDHRVAEFAFQLPDTFKIQGKLKKRIVQDAFRKILPEKIYNRPKQGFDVPLKKAFQTTLRPLLETAFADERIREQGIFKPDYVAQLRKQVFSGGHYEQNHVWALLVFQSWWQRVMEAD